MRFGRVAAWTAGALLIGLSGAAATLPLRAEMNGESRAAAAPEEGNGRTRVASEAREGDSPRGNGRLWTRAHPLVVERGVLTVDGLTVKTAVTLRIAHLHYLYVFVPGAGTAVIAEQPFSGAEEQKAAFRGRTLTLMAGGSQVQLTAANRLRGTRSAYVRFDPGESSGMHTPAISYGDTALVPAVWPQERVMARGARRRVRVSGRRALRSAKLCRPSPKGRELCATVREVVYKP